jgi:alpha-2-macroglobulin
VKQAQSFWCRRFVASILALLLSIHSVVALAAQGGGGSPTGGSPSDKSADKEIVSFSIKPVPTAAVESHTTKMSRLSQKRIQEILTRLKPDSTISILPAKVKPSLVPIDSEPPPPNPRLAESAGTNSLIGHQSPKPSLRITSYSPKTNQEFAADITIHFSEQMVPIGSLDKIGEQTIPVTLEPKIRGEWRWLDASTLLFKCQESRLPMSTRFTVRVPGDMKSVYGATLGEDFTWSFETPPLHEMVWHEDGWLEKNNLIPVYFDQKVNGQSILPFAHLSGNGREYKLRLAQPSDFDKNSPFEVDQKAVVFKAADDAPLLQLMTLTLDKGVPAEEGPLPSTQVLSSRCQVGIEPFQVLRSKKHSARLTFIPGSQIRIDFSASLADNQMLDSLVHVSPELLDQSFQTAGSSLTISGKTDSLRSYDVTLDPSIKDIYGRRLGSEQKVAVVFHRRPKTRVYDQEPQIIQARQPVIVLPPNTSSNLPIFSINERRLCVRAYKVDARDWNLRGNHKQLPDRSPDYDKVLSTPNFSKNRPNSTPFDLSPLLQNNRGQVLLDVRDPSLSSDDRNGGNRHMRVWIEKTNLALQTRVASSKTVCWVTNLTTNEPEAGVTIQVPGTNIEGTTGKNGVAEIAGKAVDSGNAIDSGNAVLVAKHGDDLALVSYPSVQANAPIELVNAFTDRGLYKPGEQVNIKGWIRSRKNEPFADLDAAPPEAATVYYRVLNRGKEIAKGDSPVGNLGGFNLNFVVPKTAELGYSNVELRTSDKGSLVVANVQFSVEEFRKPEFEMTVSNCDSGAKYIGDHVYFETLAKYFSGPGLSSAAVKWRVTGEVGLYRPPGWADYEFQLRSKSGWARVSERRPSRRRPVAFGSLASRETIGQTDRNGLSRLQLDISEVQVKQPFVFRTEATVQDLSAQTFSGLTSVLVHPAKVYIGLKTDKQIIGVGDDLKVQSVVTDVDGNAVPGIKCSLVAFREENQEADGEKPEILPLTEWTSTDKPCSTAIKLPRHGSFQLIATVKDTDGHENCAGIVVMATDVAQSPVKIEVNANAKVLQVLADKKEYEPGDEAKLHITSPFAKSRGLLTLKHRGIATVRTIEFSGGETDVTIPVSPSFIPSCQVIVDLISQDPTEDGIKAVSTEVHLQVTTKSRLLDLTVKPAREKLEPGAQSTLIISARHPDGTAAKNADLCAIVVDESVLALNGYDIANQADLFYRGDYFGLGFEDGRSHLIATVSAASISKSNRHRLPGEIGRVEGPRDLNLFQVEPTVIDERHYTSGRDERHQKTNPTLPEGAPLPDEENPLFDHAKSIQIRSNFDSLALFKAAAKTDADGYATVSFTMPDSLTRYRVLVMAAAEEKYFGKAQSKIEVDQELTVRPSPPRFANVGDRFDLPVVVRNGSAQSRQVELVMNAHGSLSGCDGFAMSLQPGQRVDAYAQLKATTSGAATVDVVVVSADGKSDVARQRVPVNISPTAEDFATYGNVTDGSVAQMIDVPRSKDLLSSELRVTLSSTAASDMHGAVEYLHYYPYGCSEQLASRIIAFSAVRKMPLALRKEIIDSDSPGLVENNIIDLMKRQNNDGGFSLWPDQSQKSVPFVTVHVLHALFVAKGAGYTVTDDTLRRGMTYLNSVDRNLDRYGVPPGATRQSLLAYACYVKDLMGQPDFNLAKSVIADTELRYVSLDILGWILPTLMKSPDATSLAVLDTIRGAARETASTAHFTDTSRDEQYLFSSPDSDVRLNALLISTLLAVQPDEALIPKIVKSLLLSRNHGHWVNTNEDAFSLLALSTYFDRFEHDQPNFAADLWIDNLHLAKQKFVTRSSQPRELKFDLLGHTASIPGALERLVLNKSGAGRLYYRVGLSYALRTQEVKALERGFTVTRNYEAADGKSLVLKADGIHIKKGTTVKVTVGITAPSHRYYVALVDQLPAGFETVNAVLKGTDSTERFSGWANAPCYFFGDHQNLRDDRTEVFKSDVPPGVYTYSYFVHATTAGQFLAPPAKVEEMYNPETFGRCASSRITIDDDERN